jgi:hypothetical protein
MKKYFGCPILLLVLLTFSCADSVPALSDAKILSVFEFSAENAEPSMFVYLLVQPTSNIDFADTLMFTHTESGFVWNIANPLVMTSNNAVWVTGPRLAPYGTSAFFTEGSYRASYTDTSGRTSERTVSLSIPEGFKTATARTAAALLPENAITRIAVYDDEDNMLYYSERSDDMATNDAIKACYSSAFSYRECISAPDNAVIVLLPPVYLFETAPDDD